MSTQLYQALETITGGLSAFMEEGADETWRQEGHPTFTLTTLRPNRLLFGYRVRYGLDASAPDPIYLVLIDHRAEKAELVLIDTPSGYLRLDNANVDVMDASLMLATTLLEDARHRRQAGGVDVERYCHWAKDAAA